MGILNQNAYFHHFIVYQDNKHKMHKVIPVCTRNLCRLNIKSDALWQRNTNETKKFILLLITLKVLIFGVNSKKLNMIPEPELFFDKIIDILRFRM